MPLTTNPRAFVRTLSVLRPMGVWTLAELMIMDAMGQLDGKATFQKLEDASELCKVSLSTTLFGMAMSADRVGAPKEHLLITLEWRGTTAQLPYHPADDTQVTLTVSGWEVAHKLGYRMPAVIRDDNFLLPPTLADVAAPQALLAQLQAAHPESQLYLQPAKLMDLP